MASFLDSFTKIFSNAHKGASVGIDVGTSAIKIVEIEKVGELATLKNYAEIKLGPRAGVSIGQSTNLSPEVIASAISDALHEAGITPRHTLLTIPASSSLLSVAELPEVGKNELEGMISNEARKYIPVPMSEVSLDWWVLPREKVVRAEEQASGAPAPLPKIDVVIAAIHNDVLKKYETIERAAQIPEASAHVEIETFSTLRSLVGRDLTPTLVIDYGASVTKFTIIDKGALRGAHVTSTGGQDITLSLSKAINISFEQAEEIKCRVGMLGDEEGRDVRAVAELLLSTLMTEAVRFTETIEQKYKMKIENIVLTGGGSRLKGLETIVQQKFPDRAVLPAQPFARLDTPAFLERTTTALGPTFSGAIGIALKGLEE